MISPSPSSANILNHTGESCQDAAVIEFQLSTSTVSRGAPYLIHHKVNGLNPGVSVVRVV